MRVAPNPAVIKREAVSRYLDVGRERQRPEPRRRRRATSSVASRPLRLPARVPRGGARPRAASRSGRLLGARDRRGDRDLPAPAGVLRQLAPGGALLPDASRSRSQAACWPRSQTAARSRSGRCIALFAVFGLADAARAAARRPLPSARARGQASTSAPSSSCAARASESVPIVMTAVGRRAGAAAVRRSGAASPGYELVHSMAVVIIGGLVTSTLLSPVRRPGPLPALCDERRA